MQHHRLYPEFHLVENDERESAVHIDSAGSAQITTANCRGHLRCRQLRRGFILGDIHLQAKHSCRLKVISRGMHAYTSGLFLLHPITNKCILLSDSTSPLAITPAQSAMLHTPSSRVSLSIPSRSVINLIYYSIPNKALRELLMTTCTHGQLKTFLERTRRNEPLLLPSIMTPEIRELLLMIQHDRYDGPAKALYLEGQLMELLALQLSFLERRQNCRSESRLSHSDVARIRKVCRHLIQHIENPPRLDELSLLANMNRNKLNTAFRELFGLSVFQWLRNERLALAQERMQNSNASLTDIAEALGYSSCSNFSHAFKQRFGISPTQYRRQHEE